MGRGKKRESLFLHYTNSWRYPEVTVADPKISFDGTNNSPIYWSRNKLSACVKLLKSAGSRRKERNRKNYLLLEFCTVKLFVN